MVAAATDSEVEPHVLLKVLRIPPASDLNTDSTFVGQRFEPLQPGGSIMKLSSVELDVKCSLIRVRSIELAKCTSKISGINQALPRSTRLGGAAKQENNATYLLQPKTKQDILLRAVSD